MYYYYYSAGMFSIGQAWGAFLGNLIFKGQLSFLPAPQEFVVFCLYFLSVFLGIVLSFLDMFEVMWITKGFFK